MNWGGGMKMRKRRQNGRNTISFAMISIPCLLVMLLGCKSGSSVNEVTAASSPASSSSQAFPGSVPGDGPVGTHISGTRLCATLSEIGGMTSEFRAKQDESTLMLSISDLVAFATDLLPLFSEVESLVEGEILDVTRLVRERLQRLVTADDPSESQRALEEYGAPDSLAAADKLAKFAQATCGVSL